MKTTKHANTLSLPLTGADHQAMALLRHIAGETAGHWGYDELARYIAAARSIVHSKLAFTGTIDALSIEGYVLKSERFLNDVATTEREKVAHRAIEQILEGNEGTTVAADAWELLSFVHATIAEAQLYGAAVMFELLGGAR